jgi:hypothetical protein
MSPSRTTSLTCSQNPLPLNLYNTCTGSWDYLRCLATKRRFYSFFPFLLTSPSMLRRSVRPCSVMNIQNKYENLMQHANFADQVWNPDSITILGITIICIIVSWTSTTMTFTVDKDVSCSLQHLLTLSPNQHSPFCHKHSL